MIRKLIFNVFLKVNGKEFNEFPIFVENKKRWEKYCQEFEFDYLFFNDDNIDDYLGEHREFYYGLEYTWQRIDFIRYLILNVEGGIYTDLDIYPNPLYDIGDLLNNKYILNFWNNKLGKNEITNSIMGIEPGFFNSLIEYSINETNRCRDMNCYKIRKIRFMLHSTGVRMFKRWCKKNKLSYTDNLHLYITDQCTATWLDNFN